MKLSRRTRVAIGLAAPVAALVALAPGSAVATAGTDHPAGHSLTGMRPVLTPVGRPVPAVVVPDLTPGQASPWQLLRHAPGAPPGTMLLASDGTVLVHVEPVSGGTSMWEKLTPDARGSYVDGTWSKIASMPGGYNPLYFASAILPTGRMLVEGGEYLGGTPSWTSKGALYNPVTGRWSSIAPPPGWSNIGDAASDVLANGTFILDQACQACTSSSPVLSTSQALFNSNGHQWTTLGGQGKNDPGNEEGVTLLPSGKLLSVDTWLTPTTELFNPVSLSWSFAGNTVRSPVNSAAVEIGPQAEMPGGNVLAVGAGSGAIAPALCTTHRPAATALYDYAAAKWVNGPSVPTIGGVQYDSADGPGATLPDGNVLFDVSPCVFNAPIAFFEYQAATRTMVAVPDVPNAASDSSFNTRLLDLPNGQVLFNDGSNQMLVYTAGGKASPGWAPQVTSVSTQNLTPGKTASLAGTQLAGLDPGAVYGDDVQNATNFPVVRITNSKTGVVTYARTSGWSNVSIAPGASSSTNFTIPSWTPAGASTLVVVANGIASQPVPVTIH